ncbi:MAG: ATP-binding cassette domain-containing protein [Coxiellaceae bacterium]|nr:ATP-binding cassette domain-containing protein [Coxiellaceae bacterium]
MQPLIEFKNTSFAVSADKSIIHNFSATINPGDFVVLLGGNGSGKSTLLKLLNRTYHHTSGELFLNQKNIKAYDEKTLRKSLITLTQFTADSIFTDLTIEENALLIESALYNDNYDKKKFLSELPHYLLSFHPTLSKALKTRMKNLSGGEQQIAAFALYLRHQPDVLLLDEHTSALDPKKANHVMEFTQACVLRKKITCLMTTHQLDYALKYGNRLMAIRDGALIFDADAEKKATLTMPDLLTYCY